MFILIESRKGRYDRDISTSVIGSNDSLGIISSDLLTRAIEDLKERCDTNYVDNAISQLLKGETSIKTDEYTCVSAKFNKQEDIIYYSIGCPSDNEYQGFTYQILKV